MKYTSLALRALAAESRLWLAVHTPGLRSPEEIRVSSHHYIAVAVADICEAALSVSWVSGLDTPIVAPGQAARVVTTPNGNAYACIAKGWGNSVVMPEGKTQHWPSDGWGWQYVGTAGQAAVQKFGWSGRYPYVQTPVFTVLHYDTQNIPVTPQGWTGQAIPSGRVISVRQTGGVSATHYSGDLALSGRQYARLDPVGQAAYTRAVISTTIDTGGISACQVVSPGQGYTDVRLEVFGDGSGALLRPEWSGGELTGVVVEAGGQGYTWCDVFAVRQDSRVVRAVTPDFYSWFDAEAVMSVVTRSIPDGMSSGEITLVATELPYPGIQVARGLAVQSGLALIDTGISPICQVAALADTTRGIQINTVITQDKT